MISTVILAVLLTSLSLTEIISTIFARFTIYLYKEFVVYSTFLEILSCNYGDLNIIDGVNNFKQLILNDPSYKNDISKKYFYNVQIFSFFHNIRTLDSNYTTNTYFYSKYSNE